MTKNWLDDGIYYGNWDVYDQYSDLTINAHGLGACVAGGTH